MVGATAGSLTIVTVGALLIMLALAPGRRRRRAAADRARRG
jgi:MYXO-CTERM domain-containing protein